MKLFETMPPFERLKKGLESHPLWPNTRHQIVLEATEVCCDRGHIPTSIAICPDPYQGHTVLVTWHWQDRGLMTYSHNEWAFITYRKLIHSPGRIGETFLGKLNMIDRFFSKMDRIKKEEEEACAS